MSTGKPLLERGRPLRDWVLAILGFASVAYSLIVLAVIAITPDLGLRFLLVDGAAERGQFLRGSEGVIIRDASRLTLSTRSEVPRSGDLLLRVGSQPVSNFLDYAKVALNLRWLELPPGGLINRGEDPLHHDLPPYVQETGGQRWIRIEFQKPGDNSTYRSAVAFQTVHPAELGLTLLWFALELGIFLVVAIAFWSRPFDESAKTFFLMCVTTLPAFVGGYYWYLIAGSSWLSWPFVLASVLVPTVTLHFFLVYPKPKPWLLPHLPIVLWVMYLVPAGAALVYFLSDVQTRTLLAMAPVPERTRMMTQSLSLLRDGILSYLPIAALYFAGTLAALVDSVRTTRNPIEKNQLRPIFYAGLVATACVVYTLVLAFFFRQHFVLGGGRLPMFLASLVFMLAYAVGIVRYKLMLVEQIVSRGMWYYVLSGGSTLLIAAIVAFGSLGLAYWQGSPSAIHIFFLASVGTLAVCLMVWLRDSWQRLIDRRFFREKYQLDKALQNMNRAMGPLTDADLLAQRLVSSCRDVLQAERASLYLRDPGTSSLRLSSVDGRTSGQPVLLPVTKQLEDQLLADVSLLQVNPEKGSDLSPAQEALRKLKAELVHSLEADGELSGLVVLGPKRGGGLYSAEDVTFLTALGQITSIALHCVKVQRNVGQLNEELRLSTERIAQQRQQILMLQAEIASSQSEVDPRPGDEFHRGSIKGNSPALQNVLETVRKAASTDASILIRGESGTGKELLAQAIHENSARRTGPLVCVHCGALAPGLLESELFGHVKGAFTGANTDRPGRFEMAQRGTIFLDEIGDISLETQIKLLRVLQERTFERVGGNEKLQVDVRILAATHQNLEQLISAGKFREDLYYRLNVITVTVPALRERREDIVELAVHFLKRIGGRLGRPQVQFDDEALDLLTRYSWPGNIRQLENVIERASVLCDGQLIRATDLPQEITSEGPRSKPASSTTRPALVAPSIRSARLGEVEATLAGPLDEAAERQQLIDALRNCGGNKARAARLLGLPRSTFFSKLKKYSLAEV